MKMLENVEKVGFWDLGGVPLFFDDFGILGISMDFYGFFESLNLFLNE